MAEVLTTNNFDEKTSEGVVLIDMYADWCGPCNMIAPVIEKLSEEVTDGKIFKVDVDQSPDLASKFQVRSIPTFIVLKDGELVNKVVGANGSEKFYLDLIAKANE